MATKRQVKGPKVYRGLADICFEQTTITEIEPRLGELRYRGYSIEDLAHVRFECLVHLLLFGLWPSADETGRMQQRLARARDLPPATVSLIRTLIHLPPHVALRTVLSAYDASRLAGHPVEAGLDLIGALPSVIIVHHAARHGLAIPQPDPALDHAVDFYRRLLGRHLSEVEHRFANFDFLLHADHGANASTFVARIVASTGGDTVAAVTAAIAALSGPLHGGGVEAVADLLDQLASPEDAKTYVAERRAQGLPVFGFGNRPYHREDPRGRRYRAMINAFGPDPKTGAIVDALISAMAPFRRFGLAPNDDLYAAQIYRRLGLSKDLYTCIVAASRIAGWIAQILEQRQSGVPIRPRLAYVGPEKRDLPA